MDEHVLPDEALASSFAIRCARIKWFIYETALPALGVRTVCRLTFCCFIVSSAKLVVNRVFIFYLLVSSIGFWIMNWCNILYAEAAFYLIGIPEAIKYLQTCMCVLAKETLKIDIIVYAKELLWFSVSYLPSTLYYTDNNFPLSSIFNFNIPLSINNRLISILLSHAFIGSCCT